MSRLKGRAKRHRVIRKKIVGNAKKPRLCVFRSNKNFSAQLVDDIGGRTLFSMTTNRKKIGHGGNVKAAALLGEEFAKAARGKGFGAIAFDRAGYLYHGRVKAFAEAARKNGLEF